MIRLSRILRYSDAQANPTNYHGSLYTRGTMRGGVPRIYYGWMKPGSFTRRRFEKLRNPFVDLNTGTSLYYEGNNEPLEALAHESDRFGLKGMDNHTDVYNEYRIVPDIYPEGFQWKHRLNSEYNQWRSNTWVTPDLIPQQHRGRFLCNFQLHVCQYTMRVAKFSPSDQRQWIYCLLYVGSGKGLAGAGRAIAPSTTDAKREAIKNAFENMQGFDLEQDGVAYPLRINYEGMRLSIYPSTKLVCNFFFADILCAFGIQRCGIKLNNRPTNDPRSMTVQCLGLFTALNQYKSVSELAAARGKVPHALIHKIYPYLEELRRRKGMMAMHPPGKDGIMIPDRSIDNRMPDHLKKGYYDDVYWKDFFSGDERALNEPRIGLRGDQLRALAPERKPGGRQGRRRTLAEVLGRVGKTAANLGGIPVTNINTDKSIPTQMKEAYKLH